MTTHWLGATSGWKCAATVRSFRPTSLSALAPTPGGTSAGALRACRLRTRSFLRHAPGRKTRELGGMLVARLMTISCPATALRTESGAKRSTCTAAAPIRSSSARFSGVRATAVTRCPAATRRGTALRPTTPVAPATKIRTIETPDSVELSNAFQPTSIILKQRPHASFPPLACSRGSGKPQPGAPARIEISGFLSI